MPSPTFGKLGHGIGIGHTYPVNSTKLMEPFLTTIFDGPQDDEIRAAHANYGDPRELNDSVTDATDLDAEGSAPLNTLGLVSLDDASIHSDSDADWYRFELTDPQDLNVTLSPIGDTYLVGSTSQNTSEIDTRAIGDLAINVRGPAPSTDILLAVDADGVGGGEFVTDFALTQAGIYYLEVYPVATNAPQRYSLAVGIGVPADPCGADGDGDGIGDSCDNCPNVHNSGQRDGDGNGAGDACDSLIALEGCPGDIDIAANGADGTAVNWTPPSVVNAFGAVTVSASHEPGGFLAVGEYEVVYTATDSTGTTARCSFRVRVNDTVVAAETVTAPFCGTIGMVPFSMMMVSYVAVCVTRRRR